MERRWTTTSSLVTNEAVSECGIYRNSLPRRKRERLQQSPVRSYRIKSNIRTPKSSSSARAAWARPGFLSGWPRMPGNPAIRQSARGRHSGSCPWLLGGRQGEREIWLWDFGGQADQRLIHQLYMDETALAVLVFDGQKEDLFETLGQWDRISPRLAQGVRQVAGRRPRGYRRPPRQPKRGREVCGGAPVPGLSRNQRKAEPGCEELKQAILAGINWTRFPAAPRRCSSSGSKRRSSASRTKAGC